MKKSGKLTWAVMALTVVAFDVAAALAVAPLAMDALNGRPSEAVEAGRTAARRVATALETHASRLAGEGLIELAKGASRLYGAMLSVTPQAEPAKATGPKGRCSGTLIPAAAELLRAPACAKPCARKARTGSSVPARFYSATL